MEQLMLLPRFHLRIFIISCYISLFLIPYSVIGQNGATANNLPAGTYSVLVTDINGCSQSDSVAVVNTGGAVLSITDSSMISCKGGTDSLMI